MTTKTDRVIQLFGKQIAQGDFTPGSLLPPEAELCVRFDASRNVMREAIRVLSTKRLIDARRRRGSFIMQKENWNYLDADVLEWALEKRDNPSLIRSLLDVRSLIEPTISRWAAQRATAVDLVGIEASLKDMVINVENPSAFHQADINFHGAILSATHNVVIQQLSDAIGALQRVIFDYTFRTDAEHLQQTIRVHNELFDAIRFKQPQIAERVSREMVLQTEQRAIVVLDSTTTG